MSRQKNSKNKTFIGGWTYELFMYKYKGAPLWPEHDKQLNNARRFSWFLYTQADSREITINKVLFCGLMDQLSTGDNWQIFKERACGKREEYKSKKLIKMEWKITHIYVSPGNFRCFDVNYFLSERNLGSLRYSYRHVALSYRSEKCLGCRTSTNFTRAWHSGPLSPSRSQRLFGLLLYYS